MTHLAIVLTPAFRNILFPKKNPNTHTFHPHEPSTASMNFLASLTFFIPKFKTFYYLAWTHFKRQENVEEKEANE